MYRVTTEAEIKKATDTLIETILAKVAEDLRDTLKIRIAGWTCPYHGSLGAMGCDTCRPLYSIEIVTPQ